MLWETDFPRQQSRLRPDAHIHIISISYASPIHNPKSSHAPRVVLVRGTVLAANVHSDIKRGPVTALFRLSEHTHVRRGAVLDLREGRDVHVWRPWFEIARPADCDIGGGDVFGEKGVVWCFTRFNVLESKQRGPAPFPMPAPSQTLS